MPRLSKQFAASAVKLIRIPPELRSQLVAELANAQYSFEIEDVADGIFQKVFSAKEKAEIPELTRSLLGLFFLFATSADDLESFCNELVESIRVASSEANFGSEETTDREALLELLGSAPMYISTKANDLILGEERGFERARIVTDVRPIFGSDVGRFDVSAAFLIHKLQIRYHSEKAPDGEFYVSLSTKDLIELREVVERAIKKSEGLGRVLPNFAPKVLDPK